VSVIVPVYNDAERLGLCLEALARQGLPRSSFEVLVVDNGSAVSPGEIVAKYPFCRLLNEPRPGSYNARNTGCLAAAGEFLAFTDADCRPHPDWLENAVEYFRGNPQTAAIGGRIELDVPDRPSAAEAYERVFAFRQDKYVLEYGFAATANLVVRRSVVHQVGLFNGAVKSGGDRDFGQRLHLAGHRMDYVPDVVVTHPARAMLGELIRRRRRLEGGYRSVGKLSTPHDEWRPQTVEGTQKGVRMGLTLLATPGRVGLRSFQGVQVLLVAGMLVVVGAFERIRLWSGGVPVR